VLQHNRVAPSCEAACRGDLSNGLVDRIAPYCMMPLSMHLRGQFSNPSPPLKILLDAANHASDDRMGGHQAPVRAQLRLRMGAIQDAAVEALGNANEPMRPRDIHASVERHLHQTVSKDTVGSFLSVAARNAAMPVIRTGPGLYELDGRCVAENKAGP
jgi:hypothetical protein